MASMYPSVMDELVETNFFKEYKKECEANKGVRMTSSMVVCELIYDLAREVANAKD